MLTVREFYEAGERHFSRVVRWFLRPLWLLLLGALITFWVVGLTSTWVLSAVLVFFLITLVAAWPIHKLARRDSRLVCPQCGRGLYRSRFRVVATRNCPRCGREILADPDPPEPPSLTLEWVERAAAQHRLLFWYFILLFGFMVLVALPVGLACDSLVVSGRMSHFSSECIAIAMLVVMFALMVRVAVALFRCRNTLIACRRCGWLHTAGRLIKTGCCANCGRVMVVPEPGGVVFGTPAG